MANQHGDFIWYELMTSDAATAMAFYAAAVGWSHGGSDAYREIKAAGGEMVGGVLQLTPEMLSGGAHPGWYGYLAVDDVDAAVGSITAAGGKVFMPARDMPGVGRMAMVADPQGAPFYVMKDSTGSTSTAFAETEPKIGHCAWNELSTTDPDAAKDFYGAQFGWAKDGEMDMGPMGKYEFLKASGGRFALGAVMPKMPEMPVSMWTFYFRVQDIDKAVETIKANGGSILQEPMEIPGGDFSLTALDPQGAAFGLVGARK
jgi:predicted enzyme related to lactoylglutathione lyase